MGMILALQLAFSMTNRRLQSLEKAVLNKAKTRLTIKFFLQEASPARFISGDQPREADLLQDAFKLFKLMLKETLYSIDKEELDLQAQG